MTATVDVTCTSGNEENVLALWVLKRAMATQKLAHFELWSLIARHHIAPFFVPLLTVRYQGGGNANSQERFVQLLSCVLGGSLPRRGIRGVEYRGEFYDKIPCHANRMHREDCDFKPSVYSRSPDEISYVLWDTHAFDLEESRERARSDDADSESMIKMLAEIASHVQRFGSGHVRFDGMAMRMANKSGVNKDHRGSDHCRFDLPMERFRILSSPFSIAELVQATLRLKCNKFDFWFELYTGLSLVAPARGELEVAQVALEFDHGS